MFQAAVTGFNLLPVIFHHSEVRIRKNIGRFAQLQLPLRQGDYLLFLALRPSRSTDTRPQL